MDFPMDFWLFESVHQCFILICTNIHSVKYTYNLWTLLLRLSKNEYDFSHLTAAEAQS
jgi:hypothetical protein